mmetsp:Transcript_26592/g.62463  ORF Transcript_26592/g.62463 Transcript_26592/m.62463 type:complete len:96 (-) Transcript_26592:57-344(-)
MAESTKSVSRKGIEENLGTPACKEHLEQTNGYGGEMRDLPGMRKKKKQNRSLPSPSGPSTGRRKIEPTSNEKSSREKSPFRIYRPLLRVVLRTED